MEKSDLLNLMAAGVVITGGGAMLSGTIELAERLWAMPVKLGIPKYIGGLTESVRNPIYATAVGLTFYGHRYHEGDSFHKKRTDNLWEDVRTSITNFFKRFF